MVEGISKSRAAKQSDGVINGVHLLGETLQAVQRNPSQNARLLENAISRLRVNGTYLASKLRRQNCEYQPEE